MNNIIPRRGAILNTFLSSLFFLLLFLVTAISLKAQDVADATYIQKHDLFPNITSPNGIAISADGMKVFVAGNPPPNGDGIALYDLGTAYDLSTATYNSTVYLDMFATGTIPNDLSFSADGSNLFVVGSFFDGMSSFEEKVFHYELSIGFDLSTASFISELDVTLEEDFTTGIVLNDNGSKLFIIGKTNDAVIEYTMPVAYDLTTASASGNSYSVSSESASPESIRFSEDGMLMFILDTDFTLNTVAVFTYNLTTAFDLTTVSYAGTSASLSENFNDIRPSGLTFGGDTKMYLVGADNDGAPIREYDLPTTPTDVTAPVVTVDALITSAVSPELSGTIDDAGAIVEVTVAGSTYPATNNGTTWTLSAGTITPDLSDGTYDVGISATDAALNIGTDATTDELTIDATSPVVTVDALITSAVSPGLSGTIDDADAIVEVTVAGSTYPATNNGTIWTLSAGTITPDLSDGTYDVSISATDAALNIGTDATTDELTIDATSPVVTVDALITSAVSPGLSGSIDDAGAIVEVTVAGSTYPATNNGTTWTLSAGTITPDLSDGTYDVSISATDVALNIGTDATTDELTIDATSPVVTVDALITSAVSPELSGTIDDADAIVEVTVAGSTYPATNNGTTWTLSAGTITPDLSDGTYDVSISATDVALNIGTDATTDELTIDATSPVVTVDALTTNNQTPELMGTVVDASSISSVIVIVNGENYTAAVNGTDWTVEVTNTLSQGEYEVSALATDGAGNVSEAVIAELIIDITPPGVLVVDQESNAPGPVNSEFPIIILFQEEGSELAEAVTGFDLSDVQLTNATISDDFTTFGIVYLITIIPDGNGDITIDIPAGAVTDLAGNQNEAGQVVVIYDITAPTVEVLDAPTIVNSLSSFTVTFEFDEDVKGFEDATDIQVVNGSAGMIEATTNNTYTASITPDGNGDITIDVPLGAAQDAAGNANEAATQVSIIYDATPPLVTAAALTTNDQTPALSGTIDDSEATIEVQVFKDSDVVETTNAINNGTTWDVADNELSTLEEGAYNIVVFATDVAGNVGISGTTLIIDISSPSVAIAGMDGNAIGRVNGNFEIEITFNEPVTGFEAGDIQLTNASVSNDFTGSGSIYSVTIVPEGNGNITVDLPSDVAMDEAGNNNLAADQVVVMYDETAPIVTINQLATADKTPELTGTVDDATAMVVITIGTIDYEAINDGEGMWSASILSDLDDGNYDVLVTATDEAGNVGTDATTDDLTVDTTGPVVTMEDIITNSTEPNLTGTVEDALSTVTEIIVTVNEVAHTATVNGNNWTVAVTTALPEGTYEVSATASDELGNVSATTIIGNLVIDLAPPTVAIQAPTSVTSATPFLVTFQFSEEVIGFETGDIMVENGSITNFQGMDGDTYTADIASTTVVDGELITVSIAAGTFTDLVGNSNESGEVQILFDPPYSGGTGTEADPYLIASDADLRELSASTEDLGANFLQTADIKLEAVFGVIGGSQGFSGSYDGDYHTIDGYKTNDHINSEGLGLSGLFGLTNIDSKIKNLGLTNVEISLESNFFASFCGSLVGLNLGSIENCFTSGSIVYKGVSAGGLVGASSGSIKNSYSDISVRADLVAGGLVGWSYGTISNSYATGSIEAKENAGGLVGTNEGTDAVISNSYATGSVVSNLNTGGLSSVNQLGATVTNCFWDMESSGLETSQGGTGLNTAQMKSVFTYIRAGWDFSCVTRVDGDGIWSLDFDDINDGYPVLAWQLEEECQLVTGYAEDLIPSASVFPSISSGIITIKAPSDEAIDQITVLDIMGETIVTMDNASYETKLDLSRNPNGYYLIRVHQGNSRSMHRIILKK